MRIRKRIAALVALLVLWAPVGSARTAPAVTMDVAVGWGNTYVVGKIAPVLVTVTNNGPEIHGALELHTGGSSGILVRREVVLPQGSTKVFQLLSRMDGIARKAEDFRVNLVVSGAPIASGQPAAVPQSLDPSVLVGGLLSDDPSGVAYCQSLTIGKSGSLWANLDAALIGEDPRLLDSFHVILVNNFDPAQLSEAQRAALGAWLNSGGAMLLGGGPGREAQLQAWGALTDGIRFDGRFDTAEAPDSSLAGAGSAAFGSKLSVSRMQGEQWSAGGLWREQNLPTMLSRQMGAGMVTVLSYDLAGTFAQWQYAPNMVTALLSNMQLNNRNIYNYGDVDYSVRAALLSQITGGQWVFLGYMAVLVLFVPASGLVCYRLLRRRGRQKLMWLAVPAISVLFSAAVLLGGNINFGRAPQAFCFTATTVSDGGEQQVRNVLFHAPVMGDYTLKTGKGLLMPLDDTLNYRNYSSSNSITNAPVTAIVQTDDPQVRFTNVNLNATRMAVLREASTEPSVQMECFYDGLVVQCKVKNNSQWPIRDAFVILGGQSKLLGTLAPAEERTYQMPLDSGDSNYVVYNTVNQLYPGPNGRNTEARMRSQVLRAYSNALTPQSQGYSSSVLGRAYFYGFSDRPWQGDLTINGRAVQPKSAELLMAYADVRRDENIPTALVAPMVQEPADGSVSLGNGALYLNSGQQATLAYRAQQSAGVRWTKMVLRYNSFDADGKDSGQIVRWLIYNYASGQWAELDANGTQLLADEDSIGLYLNADGVLQLRAIGVQDMSPMAPTLVLTGVKQ